jgi:hypothetical protein
MASSSNRRMTTPVGPKPMGDYAATSLPNNQQLPAPPAAWPSGNHRPSLNQSGHQPDRATVLPATDRRQSDP